MTGCKWCGTTTTWRTESGLTLCVGCNRDPCAFIGGFYRSDLMVCDDVPDNRTTIEREALHAELVRCYCPRCCVALVGDNGVCGACKAKEASDDDGC